MIHYHSVLVIGQLPPPLHGLSYITKRIIEEASIHNQNIIVNDIAPIVGRGILVKHASRIFAVARACCSVVRHSLKTDRLCYVAGEGGLGQLYILAVIALARILGYSILLHHHSYAYITRPNLLTKAIIFAGGARLTHIFLCANMARKYQAMYRKNKISSIFLSNAAFVPPNPMVVSSYQSKEGELILGHLSNLTAEKGLHIFLDLVREAISAGDPIRAVLAGSAADPADRQLIEQAQLELGDRLDYRGPVYGAEKDQFYRDIDLFIFPTQYVNEAQPTVLFEAQAAGCKVVSFARGCIQDQVKTDGLVVSQGTAFIPTCLAWLRTHGADAICDRAATQARYTIKHRAACDIAEHLFALRFEER